jgi:hypothetical protein
MVSCRDWPWCSETTTAALADLTLVPAFCVAVLSQHKGAQRNHGASTEQLQMELGQERDLGRKCSRAGRQVEGYVNSQEGTTLDLA